MHTGRQALRSLGVRLAAGAAALFALNLWIVWRLLWTEYLAYPGSIEAAFISLSRYIRDHGAGFEWFPTWNCGMPFANTYQPLVHVTAALISGLADISAVLSFHRVVAIGYALGPAAVFLFAYGLTKRSGAAFLCGLLYSLTSPSLLLSSELRDDTGGWWGARRLYSALVWGDSPHVVSLTIVPLALLLVHLSLRRRAAWISTAAATLIGLVFLTNIPGTLTLLFALAAYLIALPAREWRSSGLRLVLTGAAGYLLVAPLAPPSTLRQIIINTQSMNAANSPDSRLYLYASALLIATAALRWALTNVFRLPFHVVFFILFAWIPGIIVAAWYWFKVALIPQPNRFHVGLEMAFILTGVYLTVWLLRASRRWIAAAALGAILFCGWQAPHYRNHARSLIRSMNMKDTSEYKIAQWMRANAGDARIFAPGSVAFWLNTFSDTPQITGCCTQGLVLRAVNYAHYIIVTDDGAGDVASAAQISGLWLEALGAKYVAVSGPGSTEYFNEFKHPLKFEGVLKPVWRSGGDIIYDVPQVSSSLAHIVAKSELVTRFPENGIDVDALRPYVAAIEDPGRPVLCSRWRDRRTFVVSGEAPRGRLVSVQIPFHSGWRARANGVERPIFRDGLGFMFIDPQCSGPCELTLEFTGGTELCAVMAASASLWVGALIWSILESRRRRAG